MKKGKVRDKDKKEELKILLSVASQYVQLYICLKNTIYIIAKNLGKTHN
jgi:hypothetical protein